MVITTEECTNVGLRENMKISINIDLRVSVGEGGGSGRWQEAR